MITLGLLMITLGVFLFGAVIVLGFNIIYFADYIIAALLIYVLFRLIFKKKEKKKS